MKIVFISITFALLFYILEGYIITRTLFPIACGGRFRANFARTEPALPWVLVTFPQMTRNWDFSPFGLLGTFVLFLAWKEKIRFVSIQFEKTNKKSKSLSKKFPRMQLNIWMILTPTQNGPITFFLQSRL